MKKLLMAVAALAALVVAACTPAGNTGQQTPTTTGVPFVTEGPLSTGMPSATDETGDDDADETDDGADDDADDDAGSSPVTY